MNDTLFSNYQSIYTVKDMPIKAAQETDVKSYRWSTNVDIDR